MTLYSGYTMKTEPWEHQLKALDYLMVRHYGALYTDMGTGKTKVGIDLIVNRGFNLSLIVGTKKSCEVWEDEFNLHCKKPDVLCFRLDPYSTKIKIIKLEETLAKAKENSLKLVIIINYDSIWRKPFSEKLINLPIDCVICDESHRIKSPSSKCSLYLTRLGRRVENRFLFTGTPSPESPLDVYAQYRFLQPQIFGTNFHKFRDRYENVDVQKTLYAGYRVLDKRKPYKNLDDLKEKMYRCAFYVKSNLDLPETTDITYTYTPSKTVIGIYKEVVKEGVYENDEGVLEINNALVKCLREQEILSGYLAMEGFNFTKKLKIKTDDSRETALKEVVESINKKEKIVVFVKFRYDFEVVQRVAEQLGRSYGEISGKIDDYKRFKETDDIDVLAVHYKSGSESINLTKARYCIYYSLSHSYGLYLQSRKRTHRPGQKRAVTYIHIVAKHPKVQLIDEKIMKALKNKQDLVDYIMKEGQ